MTIHLLPSRSDIAELRRTRPNDARPEAERQAIADFKDGSWNANSCDAYWIVLRADHPELFASPDGLDDVISAEQDARVSELETEAFERGNVTARGKLVREIGAVKATEAARRFGLRDLNDYAKAKPPEERTRPNAKNPFAWSAGPERDAEIARLARVMAPKAFGEFARSAGYAINGKPLAR